MYAVKLMWDMDEVIIKNVAYLPNGQILPFELNVIACTLSLPQWMLK